jgi:AcrR family transcriptional regulator
VASEAGVSRRTVFRYFPSQGQLLAAAATAMFDESETLVPDPPATRADLDAWLLEMTTGLHTFFAERVGEVFWDLYASRPKAPEVQALMDERRPGRFRVAQKITEVAWKAAGGTGRPPAWLQQTFLLHVSAFAHHGFQVGGPRRSAAETARTSAKVLSSVLDTALAQQ